MEIDTHTRAPYSEAFIISIGMKSDMKAAIRQEREKGQWGAAAGSLGMASAARKGSGYRQVLRFQWLRGGPACSAPVLTLHSPPRLSLLRAQRCQHGGFFLPLIQ